MSKKIEIDEQKAIKLMKRIIVQEANNLKTKQKSDQAMVKDIQSMIEEEVKCF